MSIRDFIKAIVRSYVPYIPPEIAAKYYIRLSRMYLLFSASAFTLICYKIFSHEETTDVVGVEEIKSTADLQRHLNSTIKHYSLVKVKATPFGIESGTTRQQDYERLTEMLKEREKIINRLENSE